MPATRNDLHHFDGLFGGLVNQPNHRCRLRHLDRMVQRVGDAPATYFHIPGDPRWNAFRSQCKHRRTGEQQLWPGLSTQTTILWLRWAKHGKGLLMNSTACFGRRYRRRVEGS